LPKKVNLPLTPDIIRNLRSGDSVLLTGTIFAARDAAHKRMIEALDAGQPLPFNVEGQVIYYTGPTPARPGHSIGAAGPTTSGRMDVYSPRLIEFGLRGMIGKGGRSGTVRHAIRKHGAIYFAALGGAGALLARSIKRSEVVAYPELGPEAILKLEVEDFPVIVVNDIYGGDLYEEGKKKHRSLI
jgi:fumarate hydratase subunit beta